MIYDILVIGGGPGGCRAAETAGRNSLSCVLFEKKDLGGVCLNEGCVPVKTLLYSAKIRDLAESAKKYGVMIPGEASLDYAAASARKNRIVRTLRAGIAARLKNASAEVVPESASLDGRTPEGLFRVRAGEAVFVGKNVILAAGSCPAVPPVPGLGDALNAGIAATSSEMFSWTSAPESLLVLGGGVIGLETASFFRSAGSAVTVVEMTDRIGGAFDRELTDYLRREYEKKGVRFLLSTRVESIAEHRVFLRNANGETVLETEKILVAAGRRPDAAHLGCESVGLIPDRGAIVTDEFMRTSVPGIYAIGDLNGKSMLAHTAVREAEIAVSSILGKPIAMNYTSVPSVIYTNPEIASVGETPESASAKGLIFREIKLPLRYSGRYLAENEGGNGFVKLTVGPENRILGASAAGNPASEMIAVMILAVEKGLSCEETASLIFPHPTVSEVFRDASEAAIFQ